MATHSSILSKSHGWRSLAGKLQSMGSQSAFTAKGLGSIPELGISPGEGNGNPPQYSCLGNIMYRGACLATVHGVSRVVYDLATKPPPP